MMPTLTPYNPLWPEQAGALIEVATFRGASTPDGDHELSNGRIVRDNVFGNVEEDALRRDFTINALFLDPVSGDIRDYVHGYKDLAERRLHLIGDPEVRYREDPVRLLRALLRPVRPLLDELRFCAGNVGHLRAMDLLVEADTDAPREASPPEDPRRQDPRPRPTRTWRRHWPRSPACRRCWVSSKKRFIRLLRCSARPTSSAAA